MAVLPLWRRVRELEAEGYRLHSVQCAGSDNAVSLVVLTQAAGAGAGAGAVTHSSFGVC